MWTGTYFKPKEEKKVVFKNTLVWTRTKTQPHKNSCISLSSVAPEGTLSDRKNTLLCTPVQLKGALCSF